MNSSSHSTLEGSPLGGSKDVRSKSRLVQQMFGAVAPHYDFLNHFLSAGRDVAWRRYTAKALKEPLSKPGCIVWDLCCGTGDLAFALARISMPSVRVIGSDFCQPMLARAQAKLARKPGMPSWAAFVGADTLSLPLRDASVDVITSGFGFRNLADYRLGIAEISRVLKPGGRLAILEFSRVRWPVFGPLFRLYFAHILPTLGTWISGVSGPYQYLYDSASRFPDQEAFASLLRRSGFSAIRCQNFMGGIAALHSAQKQWAAGGAVLPPKTGADLKLGRHL